MGHYSGNGIVTGGDESINPFNSLSFKDNNNVINNYYLEQKITTSTNVKQGVSLSTAQETHADISMSEKELKYWWHSTTGGYHEQSWILPSCKGTKSNVSYRQIGDSNLYELVVNSITEQIRVKINNGNWSNWE